MVLAGLIPIVDAVATLGFLAGAVIGIANYRDTDIEQTFWAVFVGVSATGALWMGLVTVEWIGIQGALMDSLSTSLQAIVIGVFSIGAVGTMAVVQDLKQSQAETERQNRDLQTSREETKAAQEEAVNQRERAEERNEQLVETARSFGERMELAADGDLTQRLDTSGRSDAMASIGDSFNEMLGEFEATLGRIRGFADEVAASSEQAAGSAEETRDASGQVATSIQAISSDSESQSESLREVSSEMQSLSGAVEEVASSANGIASRSEESARLGQTGRDAATGAADEMAAIRAQSDATITDVESLAAELDAVDEMADLIADITEQTHMLALNASIEAARAGEAGKGFAVVADEIKELANETAEATENIETRLTRVNEMSDGAVDGISEMDRRVSAGVETISDATDALEAIAANVEEVDQGIQEINDATDDQAASAEEVASMVDDVTASARQVSAESDNVSAAAEEQTASLSEVAHGVESLSSRANALREHLSRFEMAADTMSADNVSGQNGTTVAVDGGVPTE